MLSYKVLFDRAAEEGIEALEVFSSKSSNFSFSLFRSELDSYKVSDSFNMEVRGIVNGQFGYASCEKFDREAVEYIVSHIKENAGFASSEEKAQLFKGSEKYHRKNVFNKELAKRTPEEKIAKVREIDRCVRAKSELMKEVQIMYSDVTEEVTLMNSYGLKLSSKTNYGYIYCSAIAVDDKGETKNGADIKIFSDLAEVDADKVAEKAVEDTLSQFGSAPCASGTYREVLNPETVSSLLPFFISNLSSEQVQKKSSLLAGKLNEKVVSRKLTISENPLQKNVFFRYFDDEGVATENKVLIDKGILKTYLYNLATAEKDGVTSTGNGYKRGGKIGVSTINVAIKPGKLSEEELIEKCGEGIYITDVSGLHAGLNAQSGNFSLLSQGFMIRNGKKAEPVALITAAGNLFTLFNDVEAVGNNVELKTNSCSVPSLLVKGLQISGN